MILCQMNRIYKRETSTMQNDCGSVTDLMRLALLCSVVLLDIWGVVKPVLCRSKPAGCWALFRGSCVLERRPFDLDTHS